MRVPVILKCISDRKISQVYVNIKVFIYYLDRSFKQLFYVGLHRFQILTKSINSIIHYYIYLRKNINGL